MPHILTIIAILFAAPAWAGTTKTIYSKAIISKGEVLAYFKEDPQANRIILVMRWEGSVYRCTLKINRRADNECEEYPVD